MKKNVLLLILAIIMPFSVLAWDGNDLKKINDSGDCISCNLTNLDLSGADLRKTNFCRENLSGAKLIAANFRKENIRKTSFFEADLSKANFTLANLSRGSFLGFNLSRANLTSAKMGKADLSHFVICGTIMPDEKIDNSGCK